MANNCPYPSSRCRVKLAFSHELSFCPILSPLFAPFLVSTLAAKCFTILKQRLLANCVCCLAGSCMLKTPRQLSNTTYNGVFCHCFFIVDSRRGGKAHPHASQMSVSREHATLFNWPISWRHYWTVVLMIVTRILVPSPAIMDEAAFSKHPIMFMNAQHCIVCYLILCKQTMLRSIQCAQYTIDSTNITAW